MHDFGVFSVSILYYHETYLYQCPLWMDIPFFIVTENTRFRPESLDAERYPYDSIIPTFWASSDWCLMVLWRIKFSTQFWIQFLNSFLSFGPTFRKLHFCGCHLFVTWASLAKAMIACADQGLCILAAAVFHEMQAKSHILDSWPCGLLRYGNTILRITLEIWDKITLSTYLAQRPSYVVVPARFKQISKY